MLFAAMCYGCNAGVAAVTCGRKGAGIQSYVKGCDAALLNYLGHTVTAMSYQASSSQLTLHLQSPAAAAAAQQAAEEAAAAVEAAATWQVHQVRLFTECANASWAVHALCLVKRCSYCCDTTFLVTLGACWHSTGGLLGSQES
jgi:hypothetical protein